MLKTYFQIWKKIILNIAVKEIEALMIAVFFHDMGMTITREKEHGHAEPKFLQRILYGTFFSSTSKDLKPSLK